MGKRLVSGVLAIFSLFAAAQVAADGMVVYQPNPYSGGWDYSDESDQRAYINYRNGLEKMAVVVNIGDLENRNAVWLFPVPASPEKVVIDVVDDLPEMYGVEVKSKAAGSLSETKDFLFATQIYPILSLFSAYRSYSYEGKGDMLMSSMDGGVASEAAESDVVVYEHLDKGGLSTEIITAKTANGIYDYFEGKGLKIERGMIPALDAYIGKDYSFVASWIENGSVFRTIYDNETLTDDWGAAPSTYASGSGQSLPSASNYTVSKPYRPGNYYPDYGSRGIMVYFPSEDIYFPLLPTSVYDSKTVPATIKVVGYVEPRIYENIANFAKVGYYTDAYYSYTDHNGYDSTDNFFDGTVFTNYTKIEINAPSKYLTEDLWIRDRAPMAAVYPAFIAQETWAVKLILLVLCSVAAAFAAGMVLLKDLRNKPRKLILLGLANCLSLIGLAVAVFHAGGTKTISKEESALLEKIRAKGYYGKRRCSLMFYITGVFVLLLMILGSTGLGSLSYGLDYYIGYRMQIFLLLFLLYLPPLLVFLGWRSAQVASEDRPLFADLKAKGYSTWSFKPQNRNPWLFIAFFSVLFLLFSLLSVWLLKLGIN